MSDIDTIEEVWPGARESHGMYPTPYSTWRRYRIEYGGHAEECQMEGVIYLPPSADPEAVVALIRGMEALDMEWHKGSSAYDE